MDSQPSGNSEIVFVETDEIYFSIKADNSAIGQSKESTLNITCSSKVDNCSYNSSVYLKEYKNYEIIIEAKYDSNIEFYHENLNIRNKVTPTGRNGRMLSGIINFRGDIGYSDLYVFVNGKEHLKVTVEIFPTKINYKEDYKALLKDINEEVYNLAYGFLGRTYLGAEIINKNYVSNTEFYSILNYVYKKLIKAIDIAIYQPHHMLIKEERVCKQHALKNSSRETIKWLEKRSHLIKNIDGRYLPTEALQITKSVTLDTKENRFLKFILLRIVKKIDGFINVYEKSYWKCEDYIIDSLKNMKKEIVKKINSSFLRGVDDSGNIGSISLVFSMASGYREIYKYYLMLQKGLNINSNLFSISMKDLPLLYEYWCFIKINSLLKKKYNLISSDLMKINNDGVVVSLRKGVKSSLLYENPETKEKFRVMYNSKCLSKTVSQKPDNIVSLDKEGGINNYQFIFDAKYKVDYSDGYRNMYGGIGPKEEDINTMHRYRDAILYNNKENGEYENCIIGAFVLFPYGNEEEFKEHRFYQSIKEVNIGAIPFIPSATGLMEEFLEEIIMNKEQENEQNCLDINIKEINQYSFK